MKAEILKVSKVKSRYGGDVYVLFAKTLDKGSWKIWVDPKNRNFGKWSQIIEKGQGIKVENLVVLNEKNKTIDADSDVVISR